MSENFEHTLDNLEVYQLAIKISDFAWGIFNLLSKNFQIHIGNQFLDAADSIGANIAEGYGRYHYREAINFNNYARGSAMESRFWANRLFERGMIKDDIYDELIEILDKQINKINGYNKYLRKRLMDKD
jgi:four helix bundle protein